MARLFASKIGTARKRYVYPLATACHGRPNVNRAAGRGNDWMKNHTWYVSFEKAMEIPGRPKTTLSDDRDI